MKTIFENVIKRGGYDLTALLAKIDSYHIEGKLTDVERDELYALARAKPEAQYNCKSEIEKLWIAVIALQNKGNSNDNGSEESGDNNENKIYPWKQPTGAHDAYMYGDKMIFTDGLIYMSVYDGANNWSPLVYPDGWVIVE